MSGALSDGLLDRKVVFRVDETQLFKTEISRVRHFSHFKNCQKIVADFPISILDESADPPYDMKSDEKVAV